MQRWQHEWAGVTPCNSHSHATAAASAAPPEVPCCAACASRKEPHLERLRALPRRLCLLAMLNSRCPCCAACSAPLTLSVCVHCPDARSHTLTVQSPLPVTTRPLLLLTATLHTTLLWPCACTLSVQCVNSVLESLTRHTVFLQPHATRSHHALSPFSSPVSTCSPPPPPPPNRTVHPTHTCRTRSQCPVSTSQMRATASAHPSLPLAFSPFPFSLLPHTCRIRSQWPVSTSQIRATMSAPHEITRLPSGLKTRLSTARVWPCRIVTRV